MGLNQISPFFYVMTILLILCLERRVAAHKKQSYIVKMTKGKGVANRGKYAYGHRVHLTGDGTVHTGYLQLLHSIIYYCISCV